MAERLTVEQLTALAPGDPVTIESHREGFSRTRRCTGTVARVAASGLLVKIANPRGGRPSVERYDRRTGLRQGGVTTALLVNGDPGEPTSERQRQAGQIDRLYLAWRRNRCDVDALRELHAAIAEQLAGSAGPGRPGGGTCAVTRG
ncbi:hypothetical protein SAMN05660642_04635 [Geodermatophilus siccatus]|uniref:Uncharacterized protein n=1 Tax=Geodermatophilus siccatus TaxID=1137991 RepID=A0A1H0ANB8_9ACTN|nr:hypothetical protein [Geodermatophilus siccatus]SDN35058.1 hypothetical protein SAMN05660642_04635 [Geodermatophilus siccatus]